MTSGNKVDYAIAVVSRFMKRIDTWELTLLHLRVWPLRECTEVNCPLLIIMIIIIIISIIIIILSIYHTRE